MKNKKWFQSEITLLIASVYSVFDPLGFKLRVSNVGSPACDNNV